MWFALSFCSPKFQACAFDALSQNSPTQKTPDHRPRNRAQGLSLS
jgi:hypothetical protein